MYPCCTKNSSQNSSAVICCRQSPQNEYSSPPTAIIGTMPTLDSLISGDSQKKHLKLLPIDLVLSLQLKSEQEGLQITISDSHSAKTKPSSQCGSVVNPAWIADPRSLDLGKKTWHWPQIGSASLLSRPDHQIGFALRAFDLVEFDSLDFVSHNCHLVSSSCSDVIEELTIRGPKHSERGYF